MVILSSLERMALAAALALTAVAPALATPACKALPAEAAAALLGAALPENVRRETPPTRDNGHDATSVCGWFPKGYRLATADAPPERGVLLSVHRFRSAAEARRFYEFNAETAPGAQPLAGLGEEAAAAERQLGGVNLATVIVLAGPRFVQVQVWRKGGAAAEAASSAARQAVARL
jgi:hypothetical protein